MAWPPERFYRVGSYRFAAVTGLHMMLRSKPLAFPSTPLQGRPSAESSTTGGVTSAPPVSQLHVAGLQWAIDQSPRMLSQRRAIQAAFGVVQARGAGGVKIGFQFETGDDELFEEGKALILKCWAAARNDRHTRKTDWLSKNMTSLSGMDSQKVPDYAEHLEQMEEEAELFEKNLQAPLIYDKDSKKISYKREPPEEPLWIATLLVGAEAFSKVDEADQADAVEDKESEAESKVEDEAEADAEPPVRKPLREIHKKVGREDQRSENEAKEYIKDQLGAYTRRYAYVEKNFFQMMDFFKTELMTGRFQQALAAGGGKPEASTRSPKADKILPKVKPATLSRYQIAVAHQYMGSSSEQRGVSLTSTAKPGATVGNEGKNFREGDGFRLKVDLALVPPEILLINHYSNEGMLGVNLDAVGIDRRKIKNTTTRRAGTSNSTGAKAKNRAYPYGASVTKNRELFLERLRPEWVVAIEHHPGGGYGSAVVAPQPIQSLKDFQDLGATYSKYWAAFDAELKHDPVEDDPVAKKGQSSAKIMMEGYEAGEVALGTDPPLTALEAHGRLKAHDTDAKKAQHLNTSDGAVRRQRGYSQWQVGYVRALCGLAKFSSSAEYAEAMAKAYNETT
ncbi:hypothetical protein CDN98_07580 [Roseateles terrae]|nr:hypothetical protein CDN98_07580 [Roseateles terrae]